MLCNKKFFYTVYLKLWLSMSVMYWNESRWCANSAGNIMSGQRSRSLWHWWKHDCKKHFLYIFLKSAAWILPSQLCNNGFWEKQVIPCYDNQSLWIGGKSSGKESKAFIFPQCTLRYLLQLLSEVKNSINVVNLDECISGGQEIL